MVAKSRDKHQIKSTYNINIIGEASNAQASVKTQAAPKLQTKSDKQDQQVQQSSTLASYFNKTNDNDDEDDATPWGEIKSNDWGDTLDIEEDKWEDFSASASSQQAKTTTTMTTATKSSAVSNPTTWVQDKPATQAKNDWDTDAFFNDVLTTTTKPRLKTSRH
ncbi:unnamed protein product [Rotaria socialis]|uniref:Uncharacterized protein n=1 Tax=Rotaria socialis TaxID=392032 RepID=A0A817MD40_9BILA|nr:unnamed protein product [Rotaria socialis]CAF3433991.1 unnamed protein product [Rotaria socialis]CAF3600402.1 unnamed protein product [Rotaria socialis]CAF4495541.1 unnamed protein product [Rotaria socialis]CAF4496138.1 unnamed protein product [Rotaria socialis]